MNSLITAGPYWSGGSSSPALRRMHPVWVARPRTDAAQMEQICICIWCKSVVLKSKFTCIHAATVWVRFHSTLTAMLQDLCKRASQPASRRWIKLTQVLAGRLESWITSTIFPCSDIIFLFAICSHSTAALALWDQFRNLFYFSIRRCWISEAWKVIQGRDQSPTGNFHKE